MVYGDAQKIRDIVYNHICDAMEYARQLERYVLDDLVRDDTESDACDAITHAALYGILKEIGGDLGLQTEEYAAQYKRAAAQVEQFIRTDWGSTGNESHE